MLDRVFLWLKCHFSSTGALFFWHTLNNNSELRNFFHYLIAQDNTHNGMGFVLFIGRDIWIFYFFDLNEPLRVIYKDMKQVCLMTPKVYVLLSLQILDYNKTL